MPSTRLLTPNAPCTNLGMHQRSVKVRFYNCAIGKKWHPCAICPGEIGVCGHIGLWFSVLFLDILGVDFTLGCGSPGYALVRLPGSGGGRESRNTMEASGWRDIWLLWRRADMRDRDLVDANLCERELSLACFLRVYHTCVYRSVEIRCMGHVPSF